MRQSERGGMRYILVINNPDNKYVYNVWSVFEYRDGEVSPDTRIFCSDDQQKFLDFLKTLPAN